MTSSADSSAVATRPTGLRLPVWLLLLLGWTVPAIISASQAYFLLTSEGNRIGFGRAVAVQLPLWWFWAAATPGIAWLSRRWPLERGRLAVTVPVHATVGLVVAVLHAVLTAALNRAAFAPPPGEAVQPFVVWVRGYLWSRFQFELLTYALVLLLVQAVAWYRRVREREVAATRLAAQLARAELLALKMQLHPHFLFNTLHAISVLVRENPTAAQRTITQLGDLLRATLANAGVQEVSLAEELGFLRRYLEIEQLRFQDRLTVRFEVEPTVETAMVPNLILQPLVENAVRHAVEPQSDAGTVVVRARRDGAAVELAVLDDGPGLAARTGGNGIGLSTTRARLQMLYGESAGLALTPRPEGGLSVTVRLPYRAAPTAGITVAPSVAAVPSAPPG